MGQVGEIQYHVQGDVGGIGVSRFRFVRQDAGNITGSDANAAAAAARGLFNALTAQTPAAVTWVCGAQVNIYDSASGLVQGPLVVTSLPGTVTGSASGNYPAGMGIRVNWKTSTPVGRRLLRGATFIVPMASAAFTSTGAVSPAIVSSVNGAAAAYLTAMTTATLYPVVWHRPRKGQTSGGVTGIVFSGVASAVPAGLRTRRS